MKPFELIKEFGKAVSLIGAFFLGPPLGVLALDAISDTVLDNTLYSVSNDDYAGTPISNTSLRHYMPPHAVPDGDLSFIVDYRSGRAVSDDKHRRFDLSVIEDAKKQSDLRCAWDISLEGRDLSNGGLSVDEYEEVQECLRSYNPSVEVSDYFSFVRQSAAETMQNDSELLGLVEGWEYPVYLSEVKAAQQYWIKQHTLQRMADIVRAEAGLEPVPVYLVPFSMTSGLGGFASTDPDHPLIVVNYHEDLGNMDELEEVYDVLFEEIKHTIDISLAQATDEELANILQKAREKHGEAIPDLTEHIHATRLNLESYYRPQNVMRIFGVPIHSFDFDRYEDQYVERNAKDFAKRMGYALNI